MWALLGKYPMVWLELRCIDSARCVFYRKRTREEREGKPLIVPFPFLSGLLCLVGFKCLVFGKLDLNAAGVVVGQNTEQFLRVITFELHGGLE
jgi:hypothetical protein